MLLNTSKKYLKYLYYFRQLIFFLFVLFFFTSSGWALESAEEWFKKGVKNIEVKNYEEAVYCFEKTIDLNSTHVPSYVNLGYLYNITDSNDKAIEIYKKALALSPNNIHIHKDLGLTFYKEKMLDEAIEEFKKTIELDPEFASSYHMLGIIYLEKKRFDEAVTVLEKALKISPEYPAAHSGLGQAYKELGKNILGADQYYQAGILYLKEKNRKGALAAYKNILYCSKEIADVFLKKLYPEKDVSDMIMPFFSQKKDQWYTLFSKMNIRKDPSVNSKIIGVLDEDKKFQIISESQDNTPLFSWYLIKTESGLNGWLCGIYKGIIRYKNFTEQESP